MHAGRRYLKKILLGFAVAQASSFGFGVRCLSVRIYKWKLRQPEQSHVTAVAIKTSLCVNR